MTTRMPCCVPFCRRTTRVDDPVVEWPDTLWICSTHWRSVPVEFKQVKRRARRAMRIACEAPATVTRFARVSARCTREAIERAAGVA